MRLSSVAITGLLLSVAIFGGRDAAAEETWVFTTFAGVPPGAADGVGSDARFYIPSGAAVDLAGNVFIADSGNHTIRRITPTGVVSTFAGQTGTPGFDDGRGGAARFTLPQDVAVDHFGIIYVADAGNHTIRKITAEGVVTTLAGLAGSSGSRDGIGALARFNFPASVAVDPEGNVYATDSEAHTIRKVTPAGVVTTLAGIAGVSGDSNGTGTKARFNEPMGIEFAPNGNLYVADLGNFMIRKVSRDGVVRTHAGHTEAPGNVDGTGSAARFEAPIGIAVDASSNVFVSDRENNNIRRVSEAGVVTTLAGQWMAGSIDGVGSAARFDNPAGIGADAEGNVFVCELDSSTIRKVTPAGVVTTFAGLSSIGSDDGAYGTARFHQPTDVAVDASGALFIADRDNQTIRRVSPNGAVTTVAGLADTPDIQDGVRSAARFWYPRNLGVAMTGEIYVTDGGGIRKIATNGSVTTFAGGLRDLGFGDGDARFVIPFGIAVDAAGGVLVADMYTHRIVRISPAGVVQPFAGRGGLPIGGIPLENDGSFADARFYRPAGIAVGPGGYVFVTEREGATIRKLSPAGAVTTLAGKAGEAGIADGVGNAARFTSPTGVGVDAAGNLFVSELATATMRKVTPAGVVSTIAGTPIISGWRKAGAGSRQFDLGGVAVDSNGVVYVADLFSNSIRRGVHCVTGAICALNGRFQLSLTAKDPRTGATGPGVPLQQNDIFGYFSIPALTGNARNPEVFVKMLDGRSVNGNFWVFYGGLTDFEYVLTVKDTTSGDTTIYTKPGGSSTGGFDVGGGVAADSCPSEIDVAVRTPVTPAPCSVGSDRLCLNGGRFRVELVASDPRTEKSGPGLSIPQDDLFGYFALPALTGNASIPEVFVKVLDGRAVNGYFWVFLSGLTDVAFRVTVTDTVTGERRTYDKESGSACGAFDVIAF